MREEKLEKLETETVGEENITDLSLTVTMRDHLTLTETITRPGDTVTQLVMKREENTNTRIEITVIHVTITVQHLQLCSGHSSNQRRHLPDVQEDESKSYEQIPDSREVLVSEMGRVKVTDVTEVRLPTQ